MILVSLKRIIRIFFGNEKRLCLRDGNYFKSLFAGNYNFQSLSFDEGVVHGNFKGAGYTIKIRENSILESSVYIYGVWEPQILEMISSCIGSSNGIVIDVGANVGLTSIPLAKHHPETKFILFEPHPYIYKDLCNNVKNNKLENIVCVNKVVSNSTESHLPFYAQKIAKNHGLSSLKLYDAIGDYEVVNVNCVRIDEVFEKEEGCVKVIKIDVQGGEFKVLLSAVKTIEKNRPIIIFEFESVIFKDAAEELSIRKNILKFFKERNYELYFATRDFSYWPRVNLSSKFHGDIVAFPFNN